jgi:hypothetical protein
MKERYATDSIKKCPNHLWDFTFSRRQRHDDGGSNHLWNVGLLRDYTALHTRRSNLHPNHSFKTNVDTFQGIRWRQYFSVTISTYESAWRYNPEEYCHHPKHRENLKSHKDDTRLLTLMFLLLTNSLEIKIVPNDVSSLPDHDKNLVIIRFICFRKCACVAYQPQRETSFLDKWRGAFPWQTSLAID